MKLLFSEVSPLKLKSSTYTSLPQSIEKSKQIFHVIANENDTKTQLRNRIGKKKKDPH